jgi:signal transduction histidine kinase
VRIAVLGFAAMYVPVLLLFGVVLATEDENRQVVDGVEVVESVANEPSPWITWTVVALGPLAAAAAWWIAGRAVRPIDRVRRGAEEIEASDLSRRIDLTHGPSEVLSLAASFDAMLDRLQRSAEAQQQLIEQTSHELRTPLAVITTNADVVLAHPSPTPAVYREGIERSRAAALRLQSTIDDLLIDARASARTTATAPVDLVAVARDAIAQARPLADAKQITLALTAPDAALCPVDEPSVRRAIGNLLDNAVRYAPPDTEVEAAIEADAEAVAFSVTDHGPGIPAESHDRVFERYWRGRADTKGSGLGLAIVKQVATAHGGGVDLVSPGPSGDGSVFRMTFRRTAEPSGH